MRFCLQFATRYCSISAIALLTLLGGSADAAQAGYGYQTTQYGAFSPAPASAPTALTQNFATSRPYQSDPTGSTYQSMSPDSWGNSGPSGADPFSAGPSFAPRFAPPSQRGQGSFAYGQPPLQYGQPPLQHGQPPFQNPIVQNTPPAHPQSPAQQYESTGAPSVEQLLSNQTTRPSPPSNRVAPPSPFRPAEFDLQDPKDIPLAPKIPSSILDLDNNRLDSRSPNLANAVVNVTPPGQTPAVPRAELQSPENGIQLEPAAPTPTLDPQLPTTDNVVPGPLPRNDSVQGKIELPNNPLPPTAPQTLNGPENSLQQAPEVQYPQTTAQPFSVQPSPEVQYPQTTAQPFGTLNQAPQVQAPQVPLAPYQLPQVFQNVPANAGVPVPTAVAPQPGGTSGFGWGNAPGIFQQRTHASPAPPHQLAPQAQPKTGPSFTLPFGMGSKLFKKRFGSKKSQLDLTDPNFSPKKRPRLGQPKPVDPNTYPPQPVPHSQTPVRPPSGIPPHVPNAQFRPDLAQRAPLPTVRNPGTYDSGRTKYDFEEKKREFPPFSEILATGRYFGSIEGQLLKPRFNGTSGITILDQSSGTNFTDSHVFDFGYDLNPSVRVGFESKYGPGFEFDYREIRSTSDLQSFTSGVATSASLRSALPDVSLSSVISTTAPGQTLSGTQNLEVEEFGFSVFKEVQLPVTRINGMFGFQTIDIDHEVDATVTDGAGAVLQSLSSRSDMRAVGPRVRLEYFRPVGHTRLEFLTRMSGALLFGKRDQFITEGVNSFQRVGTDEIVTKFGFLTALQIKQRIGENRSVFGRIGYLNESFNSGGSGFLAQDDFGVRGITFLVGVNR